MHNTRTGRGGRSEADIRMCPCTHSHTPCADTRGTYELNLASQTEFLILSLGIIVRMWHSDQTPASKAQAGYKVMLEWNSSHAAPGPQVLQWFCGYLQQPAVASFSRTSALLFLCFSSFSLFLSIRTIQLAHLLTICLSHFSMCKSVMFSSPYLIRV